jgi:hypothetical protein
MSNRAKKISELTTANTINNGDFFILVANVAGTLTTRKLTVSTFRDTVTFPDYANTTYAGIVKIGSQLAVTVDGLLTANIRTANTTSFGTVKIGSQLAIDQNGFLVANIVTASNSTAGIVAVGNNLTINSTGFLSANVFIANSTILGKVGVGNQLSINATGFLSANINQANTTSAGVVRVGNNLSINTSGHLSAVLPIANVTSAGMIIAGNTMAINELGVLNVNTNFANTTSPGIIFVGDQLHMDDETYQLSANIRIANTTSAGIIKVGNQLTINATGFLNANVSAANVGSASQLESNGFIVSISEADGRVTVPGDIYLPGTNNHLQSITNTTVELFSGGVVEIKAEDLDGAFHSSTVGVRTNNSAYINVKSTDFGTVNWKFDRSGTTTFPANTIVVPSTDVAISIGNTTVNTTINTTSISTRSNTGVSLRWANNTQTRSVSVSNNTVSILVNESEWDFRANGTILFPDNSVQNTAFMYRTTPPTAPDATGIKGEFAIDNDYFYVCAGDGVWKRIAYDNTWN